MWWRAAHICREGYSNMFVPLLSFFSYFDTLLFIIKKMYVFSLLFKPITDEPDIGKPTQLNWFRKKNDNEWHIRCTAVDVIYWVTARGGRILFTLPKGISHYFFPLSFLPPPVGLRNNSILAGRDNPPQNKRTITTQFRFLFERVFAIVESVSEIPTKEGHSRQHKSASVSN
jgi:hypothetical protein